MDLTLCTFCPPPPPFPVHTTSSASLAGWIVILASLVRCVQAALVRKDEEMDQELSSLRQQHQRLKLQFQARKPLQ